MIHKDEYTGEMNNFARWVSAVAPALDRPWIYPIRNDGSEDARQLFDHGFVVGRVLELAGALEQDLDGLEFGIVSRTYATHLVDNPPKGLRVIRLPYPETHGTPVLIVPEGPGDGTIAFLYALRDLSADYFSCALSLPLSHDYRIEVGYADGALSQMHISLIPRED